MAHQVSPEVLQLQQQLIEKEHTLQCAILIAGQHQARVLSLEDLIDDKNDVKEKAAKGIAIEKEKQKNREMELHQDNEQLKQGNADLRRTEIRLISKVKDLRVVLREKGDAEIHNDPQMKEEPIESDEDNQISIRDVVDAEGRIEDEEVSNDDVLSRMSDADVKVEDSVDDLQFNPDDSTHGTSHHSDFAADDMDFDGEMNDDRDITVGDNGSLNHSANIEDMNGTGQPAYEQEDSMADDLIEREEETEETTDIVMKYSEVAEVKKGRRSSRVAAKPLQYKETDEDSEEDDEPTRKKSKSEPEKKKKRKSSTNGPYQSKSATNGRKMNDTELKCPECEFLTRSVCAWEFHLMRAHSTNVKQAGLALRCACGVDCFTNTHFRSCKVANANIIKIDDMKEPVANVKMNDTELKCPECEYHTRSVCAWEFHLMRAHSTNVKQAGLALRCACGVDCFTDKHFRKCKIGLATVIKIDDMKESLANPNDTELECPECEYRSTSVIGWRFHLSRIHSTTPALAGLVLRCDCGHESLSEKHTLACKSTNVVVIRKRDGPIRRFHDQKESPQCILCEFHPATIGGYEKHIRRHHNTTLKEKGIYLKCACDFKVTSNWSTRSHNECDGRSFTLHKLHEDEE